METRRRVEARFEANRWSGADWVVAGATLRERLNEPFELDLDIANEEPEADASPLLGSSCVLTLTRRATSLRVCGVITRVREGTDPNQNTYAHLRIEPALSALRYRSDTRIFQGMSVPEILAQVLSADLGVFGRTVESRLDGTYPAREYTVQYQETDFDFVHRLMEEEGIGYMFDHEGAREVLVLFDRPVHLVPLESEDGSTLRYVGRDDAELDSSEGISRFERVSSIRPNRIVTRHFDWTHPSVPMTGETEAEDPAWPALETYVHDAPLTLHAFDHTYGAHNAGDQLRLHAELARRDARLCDGTGSALGARAGRRFELAEHPRVELDGEWAVVETEHRYQSHVEHADSALAYVNRFTCLPAEVPWRPDRTRPRPHIIGIQTAMVVGPAGEEIHTDPHGRIKVQFHWDRLGTSDDNSSCWIRVMQSMGGPGWGFSFIPRIGMEIVVSFIEGDPDRPLVTGVVYNGESPPPYDYPAEKTRTTIKTNSSPGGGGYNEFRFEDKAGAEEIYLQGQKDWNTLIKHDHNRNVGRHETQHVEIDRTRSVGNNEQVTIGNSRTKHVAIDEHHVVGNSRTRHVANTEAVSVGVDRSHSVGNNESVSVGNDLTHSIGSNMTHSIGANHRLKVGANALHTVGQNHVTNVGMSSTKNVVADHALTVGGGAKHHFGNDLLHKIGGSFLQHVKGMIMQKVTGAVESAITGPRNTTAMADSLTAKTIVKITAGTSIDLTCGTSRFVMTPSAIYFHGKDIHITTEKNGHIDTGAKLFFNSGTAKPPPGPTK